MSTVGIIGAGQLGQMLGIAAARLGVQCIFLDPADHPPAAATGRVIRQPFDSEEGLRQLVEQSDVITYEFENVPVAAIERIGAARTVYPPARALETAQDRLAEKYLFDRLGIPVPAYRQVDSAHDLAAAAAAIGLPLVLKTRRLGYDGKGQRVVRSHDEIDAAVVALGTRELIAEQWVPFEREVSIFGARSADGALGIYPLTENRHANGILRTSSAPVADQSVSAAAESFFRNLMAELDYVGVLALELFVTSTGLLANEFAPRVHNSGHWTIDGAVTSQFENHLRAVLGLPLGDTAATGCAGMLNLIGEMPPPDHRLRQPPWRLHDYGKSPRPGRKLGHATIVADSASGRDRELLSAASGRDN